MKIERIKLADGIAPTSDFHTAVSAFLAGDPAAFDGVSGVIFEPLPDYIGDDLAGHLQALLTGGIFARVSA